MGKRYISLAIGLLVLAVLLRVVMSGGAAVGGGLKPLFIPLVVLYLNTFNSPSTAILLCLGMIAVAVVLMVYYWRAKFSPALRDLRSLTLDLEHLRASAGSDAALAEINAVMERSPLLARAWVLYRATLVRVPETGKIAARVTPDQYFNMRSLQMSGLQLRVFMGLPNDFVGVGLIFTFLGLVAGLYFATQSMMSADLDAARQGLVLLLHAATFKFLTSITGIFLSIVLSGMQRVLIDRLQHALHEVQYQCERRLVVAGPAMLSGEGSAAKDLENDPVPVLRKAQ